MINAPHDKEFVFHDGTRSRNILDLAYKIESLSDHAFHHFVNHSKNDFANWVGHVLLDHVLEEKLRSAHTREATLQLLKDRIAEVSKAVPHGASLGGSIFHAHARHEHSIESGIGHSNSDPVHVHVNSWAQKDREYIASHEHHDHHSHKAHRYHGPSRIKDEFDGLEIDEAKDIDRQDRPKAAFISVNKEVNKEVYEDKKDTVKEIPRVLPNVSHGANNGANNNNANPSPAFVPKAIDDSELRSIEKARKQWFKIFSKSSEKKLESIERKEEHKRSAEIRLNEEIEKDGKENILWIVLYALLILLIAGLLAYKLLVLN